MSGNVESSWVFNPFAKWRWYMTLFVRILCPSVSALCSYPLYVSLSLHIFVIFIRRGRDREIETSSGRRKNWVYMESSSTQIHQYHLCVSVYSRGRKNQYWSKSYRIVEMRVDNQIKEIWTRMTWNCTWSFFSRRMEISLNNIQGIILVKILL